MPHLSDQDFEARMDAQTLAEANLINDDPTRLGAAEVAAEKLRKEKEEQAKAMAKVSERKKGGGIAKKTSDKMFPNTKD